MWPLLTFLSVLGFNSCGVGCGGGPYGLVVWSTYISVAQEPLSLRLSSNCLFLGVCVAPLETGFLSFLTRRSSDSWVMCCQGGASSLCASLK